MRDMSVSDVELLGELFFGSAQVLGGSKLDDDEVIRLSINTFEKKHFCIVRQWMLLDVMLPELHEKKVKAQGLEPTIVYAQTVVFDSQNKHQAGGGVLSDFQRDFDGCVFESTDTIFILAGRGARKHVGVPVVLALSASENAQVHLASGAVHYENLSGLAP